MTSRWQRGPRRVGMVAVVCAVVQLLPAQTADAYVTSGCRQTFIDSGGVRKIKLNYFDVTGYTTLSPGAAGRWNSAMGPPQQFVVASDYSVFASEQDFGNGNFAGITYRPACSGGYYNGVTYVWGNTYLLRGYVNEKRFAVMVHEFGHALGLEHHTAGGTCGVVPMMYPSLSGYYDTCGWSAPRPDDIAGANAIY